jgi:hypothetical protein
MALIAGTCYGEHEHRQLIDTCRGRHPRRRGCQLPTNWWRRTGGAAVQPVHRRGGVVRRRVIVQHKGWNYHFVPPPALRRAVGDLGPDRLPPAAGGGTAPLRPACPLVCLAAGLVLLRSADWTTFKARRQDRFMRQLAGTLAELGIGRRIFVMSTSEYPAYPLDIYYDTQPATRFSHLWTIPHVVALESGPDESPQRLAAAREMSTTRRRMAHARGTGGRSPHSRRCARHWTSSPGSAGTRRWRRS